MNLAVQFIERMQKNGVDKIELMDFLFCGCIVLLGLEIVSTAVIKIAGCKLKVLLNSLFQNSYKCVFTDRHKHELINGCFTVV